MLCCRSGTTYDQLQLHRLQRAKYKQDSRKKMLEYEIKKVVSVVEGRAVAGGGLLGG